MNSRRLSPYRSASLTLPGGQCVVVGCASSQLVSLLRDQQADTEMEEADLTQVGWAAPLMGGELAAVWSACRMILWTLPRCPPQRM